VPRYQTRTQAINSAEAKAVLNAVIAIPRRASWDDNNAYYCGYVTGLWLNDLSGIDKLDKSDENHRYYEARPYLDHPEIFRMGFYDAKGLDESST
jgi:hypothetical protein